MKPTPPVRGSHADPSSTAATTAAITVAGAPWLRRFPVRTPTLPPATHTNVYAVGEGRLAVIDPASPYPEEQAALDAWLDELSRQGHEVAEILLTHHHVDHVSGAAHLAERLSVPVAAHEITAELVKGRVSVSRFLVEGERLPYGPAGLVALHTPGHAPGHLVFLDERSRSAIAGDMVASIGTIIIDPPEGDMRLYLSSLERLRALELSALLPAHGEPVVDCERLLSFYLQHRLAREAKVVAALALGPAPVDALVERAYTDVAPALYPLAARSLLAHLYKLRDEARAGETKGVWSLRGNPENEARPA